MPKHLKIAWLDAPEKHDYPAAESYLSMIFEPRDSATLVRRLRKARAVEYPAKDLFRASALPLLGPGNFHVEQDRKKVRARKPLSPVLLVRAPALGKLIIADGYHRLCAVYSFDEDAMIPCRIV